MSIDWSTVDEPKVPPSLKTENWEPLMPFSEIRCHCGHKKGMHALGEEKCDNCNCSKFRMDLSITQTEEQRLADKIKGELCIIPEAATPGHTLDSEPVGKIHRGSTDKILESGLKDSGKRLHFASGMVRDVDDNKPAFGLLIPKGIPYTELMLTRWAELLRKGAIKYVARNWEKADSDEELERAKDSAFRHFMQWYTGEDDEDHAAAVFFNINEVETIRFKQREKESG